MNPGLEIFKKRQRLQGGSSDLTPYQQGLVNRMEGGGYDYTFGPGSPGATAEDKQTYVGGQYSPAGGFAQEGGYALAPQDYYSFTPEQRQQYGIMDIAPSNQAGQLERYYAGSSGGSGGQMRGSSNNPLDYLNPFGHTSQGGSGTGDPTQRNVGRVVGTVSNFFLPGSGFITGPLARWATNLMQHGWTKDQVQQAVKQRQQQGGGTVSTGPLEDVTGNAPSGVGDYQPFGGLPEGFSESNRFGMGAPTFTAAGSQGPQFGGGSIFNANLPGGRATPLAGAFSNLGASGPVDLSRYSAAAGGSRPFTAEEYAKLPYLQSNKGYGFDFLGGQSGPGPSYEQYLAGFHAPGTVGSSTGPGGAAFMGGGGAGFAGGPLMSGGAQGGHRVTAQKGDSNVGLNLFRRKQMLKHPQPFAKGSSGIHLDPANKGLFTAKAKSAGMGVQQYASHVLSEGSGASASTRKQANFARNAKKWNH